MTKEMFRNTPPPKQGFTPVNTIHKQPVLIVHVLCLGLFILLPLVINRFHLTHAGFFFRNTPSEIRTALAITGNAPLLTVGNAKTQTRRTGGAAGLSHARHFRYNVECDHLYLVNQKIELDYET